MVYGYARCSTNEELQDINRQIRELKQLGAAEETIYREYESGTKNDRVELQRLLAAVRNGDTIVATEVSRIITIDKIAVILFIGYPSFTQDLQEILYI